ncbi:hypothetical protein KC921_00950 [Candidatus Woesebacteria bacterium]|nr:hypothetical protein [Candidatus Woesebacteria bacterium]
MSIFNKEPQLQQTEFSESQAVLEREVEVPVEKTALPEGVNSKRRFVFIGLGLLFLVMVVLLLIISLSGKPSDTVLTEPTPTPEPTVKIEQSPLLEQIRAGKARVESIEIAGSELALPQVEFALQLDEVKKH